MVIARNIPKGLCGVVVFAFNGRVYLGCELSLNNNACLYVCAST